MIKPYEWNTIVVGQWNPHILTPKGITEILFNKPGGTPIEVFVPLNAIAPFRVKIENLIVSVDFNRLEIGCDKNDWPSLEASRKAALNAIDGLPKTPLSAVGYNIRYQLEAPDPDFIELLTTELDKKISDVGFEITGKTINRLLVRGSGKINFQIQNNDTSKYNILMNFDKTSNVHEELKSWLNVPIEDVKIQVQKIVSNILNISTNEGS